jgi:hypothetical protein
MKVAKEKLHRRRENERKRRESLAMVQEKERKDTRLRTEKRLEELRLEQLRKKEKEEGQLPD